MPNRSADILFQLIRSLEKSEKRNFKLYIQRNSGNKDLKIIELFDAIDKLKEYDETVLLKKLNSIEKPQLSNIKAHLYKQLLASLRVIKTSESIDMQLHEQLDYARILYNKGLYHQSLKILEKVKEMAIQHNQYTFLIQVISFEKKIETLHITRSMQDRAEKLSSEALGVNQKRETITGLSNLALLLYSWYVKNGHARNENDEKTIKEFFFSKLPAHHQQLDGFYEKLYICQSFCWFAFIRQDFLMYYRYTQKWVDLFHQNSNMVEIETGHYIKGIHNLLNAHFDLRNYAKFAETLSEFEAFSESPAAIRFENTRIQMFVYLFSARLNQHIILGDFKGGLSLLPAIEEKLEEYSLFIDRHRIMVINYKIATIYFGADDYNRCIDYLHKIINDPVDLRTDLQCYSRLLHLISHYELGNSEIIEYLIKSVYRFMAKMQNLSSVEEAIFKFLRNAFHTDKGKLKQAFTELLEKLRKFEHNRFEARAFVYLDIISWLESKISQKPIAEIIRQRYLDSKHK
ncbi:MAG: hypothetical protein FGM46_01340 [Ferruginibacter sp.]|nr:hypothetical protein [Ferruginibacter sp.]